MKNADPTPKERGRSMKVVASTTPTTNGLSVTVSICIQHHEIQKVCTLTSVLLFDHGVG